MFFITGVTRIGRDDAPVPQDITIEGPGIEAEHCRIENRGGVIILDPCGHLCSLDGVPVTRPAQLTQGNLNMIALQWKCIYSMHVFVCLLWKAQCLSKWKGEEVYDLGMKCVIYWKCIMCLSSRLLVLDVTQSLIGVVLDLFLMGRCDSELPEVLEWATKLSFSSPRLYFPIIPAFFSLTEFLNKRSIILYAYFLSHLSESESDKHLPDLFWHFSVMNANIDGVAKCVLCFGFCFCGRDYQQARLWCKWRKMYICFWMLLENYRETSFERTHFIHLYCKKKPHASYKRMLCQWEIEAYLRLTSPDSKCF